MSMRGVLGQRQRNINAMKFTSPLFAKLAVKSMLKGTMMFPLAGSDTVEEFERDTVFTGDFEKPNVRKEIFSIPRRYSFSIVLIPTSGEIADVDIGEYDLPDDGGVSQGELSQLIKQYTHEQFYEKDPTFYDLQKSVVIIQLYHTKGDLPYEQIIRARLHHQGPSD